jgi:hypothetical protein
MCKEASNFVPWSDEKLQGTHCISSCTTSTCSAPPLASSAQLTTSAIALLETVFRLPSYPLLTLIFASKEYYTILLPLFSI